MTGIASEFQALVSVAIGSDYSTSDLFKDTRLRLATAAVNRGDIFAENMATAGHVFQFNPGHQGDIPEEATDDINLESLSIGKSEAFSVRTEQDHLDVADLVYQNSPLSPAHAQGILAWLKKVHLGSRGFELGTFKPSLLGIAMKEQSRKWKSLALGYISDIVTLVHRMITDLLNQLMPDETTRVGIQSLLMDELRKKYQAAIHHTEFLIKVELESNPATLNHYFNDTLEKWCGFYLLYTLLITSCCLPV